jgi:hypothetical protein
MRIIRDFIVFQLGSVLLYKVAAALGNYKILWNSLPAAHIIPFTLAQGLFVGFFEIALISYLFLSWYRRPAGREKVVEPLALVHVPEHERLERKSTLRWDLKTNVVNKSLEKAAVKTVAAFMNSQGGNLLLGVGDKGEAVGLEHDYATLPRSDADGLQNHFSNVLAAMLGSSLRRHVSLRTFAHDGKECLLVSVAPSDRPAYVRDQDHEEFFIRTGNGTTPLRMSDAHVYITSRFKKTS